MKNISLLSAILITSLLLPGNRSMADVSDSFKKELLGQHNLFRKKHRVPLMKQNNRIQKYAQEWADNIARRDRMYHRQPNRYGENIYWMSGGNPSGKSVVNAWYSEIKYYKYSNPRFSYKTGHFTQVVWKGSTELGCGRAKSRMGGIYVVCNYNPPGNYMRRFRENVLRPKQNFIIEQDLYSI